MRKKEHLIEFGNCLSGNSSTDFSYSMSPNKSNEEEEDVSLLQKIKKKLDIGKEDLSSSAQGMSQQKPQYHLEYYQVPAVMYVPVFTLQCKK